MSSIKNLRFNIRNVNDNDESKKPTIYVYNSNEDNPIYINIITNKQRRKIPPININMYCPYCEKVEETVPVFHPSVEAYKLWKLLFTFGLFTSIIPFFFKRYKCNTQFCSKCGKKLIKTKYTPNHYKFLQSK